MQLPRRQFLSLAAGAGVLAPVSRLARAQAYPSHPITMIVPVPAGGQMDSIARIIAEHARISLRQTIVIENVTGASGTIGVGASLARRPTATRSVTARGPRTSSTAPSIRCNTICSAILNPSRSPASRPG